MSFGRTLLSDVASHLRVFDLRYVASITPGGSRASHAPMLPRSTSFALQRSCILFPPKREQTLATLPHTDGFQGSFITHSSIYRTT